MAEATLSVIIPTLNEAEAIAGAVSSALSAGADEVVVSDAGSQDATAPIAESLGARVVTGARGRGPQLNRGAEAARGQIYCFLHADARLHPASGRAMRAALRDPGVVGGNHRVDFGARRARPLPGGAVPRDTAVSRLLRRLRALLPGRTPSRRAGASRPSR